MDLFEHYNQLPSEVLKVLDKFSEMDNTYLECEALLNELKPFGYSFEYGLDAQPFNLKKN
jgi:hypothetical protein